MTDYNLIVILGPTASGKTTLATRLTFELNSEVISADSRQVYRGMDIGTGKDLGEFVVNGSQIPYHLIDIIAPTEEFSVFDFRKRFFEAFEGIRARGIVPVLAGGTGLYLDSVLRGYVMHHVPVNEGLRGEVEGDAVERIVERLKAVRPELHNTTDLIEKERAVRALEIALYEKENPADEDASLDIKPLVFGVRWERPVLRKRITERLKERMSKGMIEEVERLHEEGLSWERLDYFGLEYRFVGQFLQGKLNRNDMFQRLNSAIHQFAKRQETWFRRMERQGIEIHWIDTADYDQMKAIVDDEFADTN